MPYFEPLPSPAQWLYWKHPGGGPPRVSKWPHAGSARNDSRFRFDHMAQNGWTASRYWFILQYELDAELFDYRGWLDLEVIAEGHLAGSAGVNSEGWECVITIRDYAETPVVGQPGVVVELRWENVGLGVWTMRQYWYLQDTQFEWTHLTQFDGTTAFFSAQEHSPGFEPTVFFNEGGSVADCYLFPLIEVEEDFANFNGVDAYIQLDGFTPAIATRWQMSGEMYLRSNLKAWLMVHSSQNLVRAGFSGGLAQYRTSTGAISPSLPLDEWFLFRFERQWTVPVGNLFKLYVNDFQVASFGGVNWSLQFDQIGHPRFGEDVPWPNYDLRNFKVLTGTPAAPVTVLNMPLEFDACDAGPNENDGETFNMALPSCPP